VKLIEVSFEVGNKVGGIHTVLASKSRLMGALFSPYLAVGYYHARKSPREFVEATPPESLAAAMERAASRGIEVHYGHWLVPGKPPAILIHPGRLLERVNDIKYNYWDWYRIDSLRSDDWFNHPVAWAYATGIFLSELLSQDPTTVVLAHEWLSGGAILYLRRYAPHVPTIFHTHATILGRTLANAGEDLYRLIRERSQDPDAMAYRYALEAKHLMEKASAQNAHVFTTVSDVTAKEAEYILGRTPDRILPNGLDMQIIPPMEELSYRHVVNEESINDFVLAYFSPYYPIDVQNTLYFFFSGRYDIRVKGIDVLIPALARLNERLKAEGVQRRIVFFFFVAREGYHINPEVLENISAFRALDDFLETHMPRIRHRIIEGLAQGKLPDADVFDEPFLFGLRRLLLQIRSRGSSNAPLSTHIPWGDDYIVNKLREVGLNNAPDDAVKIIYYPAYLSAGDGLLNMSYYDAITGTHLGVFPSYYEPWGYTPLETAAWGVPAITTDAAGFGQFILEEYGRFAQRSAISVLSRRDVSDERFIGELADVMHWYATMPRRQRLERKIEAKYMAEKADWGQLIHRYVQAAELALHVARS